MRSRENARNHHFDLELVKKIADQGYLGAIVPQRVRRRGPRLPRLRPDRRGDRPRLLVGAHGHLGADLARVLGRSSSGEPRSRSSTTCQAVLGRVARLLRADRAGHRLGRRQPEDAREEDRLGLGDQRREDVDLDGQLREGRADLRPDRPRARPQGPRLLPRRHRPAGLSRRSTIEHKMGLHASDTASIALEDVEVSDEDDARRDRRRLQGRDVERSTPAATRWRPAAWASARDAWRSRSKYAKEREQFGTPDRELPARAGDDRRHGAEDRRLADARVARGLAEGQGPAEHAGDLDRQAARHRGRRSSARTSRSRCTAAPATSTTTRSSATSATPA